MVYLIILSFILAAVLSVVLLFNVFANKTPPNMILILHTVFTVLGILLVINYTIENDLKDPLLILMLCILAALGGVILLLLRLRKQTAPKALTIVHPVLSGIAIMSLVIYFFH